MAETKRWDGSAMIALTTRKRWDGSAMVDLTTAKRWDGAAFVDIPLGGGGGSLQATVSPGNAIGSVSNNNLWTVVTSNSVTVTPVGGTGPYTYRWSIVSGDSAPVPTNPTSASSAFSATVSRDGEYHTIYKCVVTDSLLATTQVQIAVDLYHPSTL